MADSVGPAQPHQQPELQENVREVKGLNASGYIKTQNQQTKEATLKDHSVEANPDLPSYAAFISSIQVTPPAA